MLAMELPQSWNEPLILLLNIYILDIEGYLNFVSVMKIYLSAIINAVAADVLAPLLSNQISLIHGLRIK